MSCGCDLSEPGAQATGPCVAGIKTPRLRLGFGSSRPIAPIVTRPRLEVGSTPRSFFSFSIDNRKSAIPLIGPHAHPHVRESIRLNPNDAQSREFLAFIEKQVSAPSTP